MSKRTLKLGNDIFSKKLLNYVMVSPHYNTCKQWGENINIADNKTYYYAFLKAGCFLSRFLKLNTEESIINKVKDFKKTYLSIKEKGYLKEMELPYMERIIDGNMHYYGGICCKITVSGDFELWDGMHRISVCVALNLPISITIVEEHEHWQKTKEGLLKLHNGQKYLYQYIDHPDFHDWISFKDNIVKDFLLSELVYGNVLDIGVCHGLSLYRLKMANKIQRGTGIEYDTNRYNIAKIIYDKIGLRLFDNIEGFLKDNIEHFNATLMLSVIHHIVRESGVIKAKEILYNISQISNRIIYEYPKANESIITDFGLQGFDFDKFMLEATGFRETHRFHLDRDIVVFDKN